MRPKARTIAAGRPFEHFEVAVGIANGDHRAAADVLLNADGFAGLVIDEIQLRQSHDDGLTVAHFILRLDAAADDLVRRDAIDAFRPRPHELDAAAGDDEGLEAVGAQIGQQFEHGLIDHFCVEFPCLGMLRRGDPVGHNLLELLGGHARMSGHRHFQQRFFTAGERGLHVALEHRGEGFLVLPLRMLPARGS